MDFFVAQIDAGQSIRLLFANVKEKPGMMTLGWSDSFKSGG